MKKLIIPIVVLIVIIVVIVIALGTSDSPGLLALRGGSIALIRVEGGIYDSREVIRQIHKYRDSRSVKAILIRIDSPGGGVAASQEIHEEVVRTRTDYGKPVVASMGAVAASGGYYIAVAADRIVANPGTVTGSIGVIANFTNLEDLYKKIGVESRVIKSGKFKDSGSPFRDMTKEEERLLQSLVDDMYKQFVEAVTKGRNMSEEKVLSIADGRIFSGRQALELGLVDELGNLQDAIQAAAKMGGIKGKPVVVSEKKRGFSILDLILGSSRDLSLPFDHLGGISLEYRMVVP